MVRIVIASLAALVAGVAAALVGGVAHRTEPWWGLVGSILLVAAAAVFMRAWQQWLGLAVYAIAWVGVTTMLALEGPGASFLIVDDELGRAWLLGGSLAVVAIALLPRTWIMGSDHVTR